MVKKVEEPPRKTKKILVLLFLITILIVFLMIFTIVAIKAKKPEEISLTSNYIEGDIYSANAAANMIDYLYDGNNLIISPLNANISLANFYNGLNTSSNASLNKYFNTSVEETNKILSEKLAASTFTEERSTKTKYEEYIEKILNNKYNELTAKEIDKISQASKEELILLLRKTEEYYNQSTTKLKNKEIEKLSLTDKEKKYNGYTIKSMIDSILTTYERYSIINKVTNYNAIYIDKTNKVNKDYKEIIKENYNTTIASLDYNDKESLTTINTNLENNANVSIDKKFNNINSNEIISISSLYFNYEWQVNFNDEDISDEEFIDSNNDSYMVKMMHGTAEYFLENDSAIGFAKEFQNNEYSFIAILPKEKGTYNASELNLDELLNSKRKTTTYIGLPKFNITSTNDLKRLYENYNINELFTDQTNLDNISKNKLYISKMYEEEHITIDKYGTVESNTKTENLSTTIQDDSLKQVILNRSFLFLIINNENNDILLIGKYDKPNE